MFSDTNALELLAPARDAVIAIEAIQHGADAVYLGGPAFGARSTADNSVEDIARVVVHAHRFHARVFVTLNTILRDDELEPARRLIWQLWDAGVDALIVQDMGLLMLDLPPIALHASTQCDIRTPEKARFLQDVGFDQIVLARELTLEQIAAVRAATDAARCRLEFFVHGALCVAYSGQCYISMAHTGRSANRGECNQACRLPYQVLDSAGRYVAHDQHVLSLKDNNQSANLAALVDVGVRSFKIEGRYKDMAYVKNITGHYRRLLDTLMEQRAGDSAPLTPASSGRTRLAFTPDPAQNFNRAHTDYFVQGRRDDIGAFDSPKNPGQPIGHVLEQARDHFDLQLDDATQALHNGDGLCYLDEQHALQGLAINRAEALDGAAGRWRVWPREALLNQHPDLRSGRTVNRNRDAAWLRALDKPSAERRVAITVQFDDDGDTLTLALRDADGCTAQARCAWPAAQRQRAAQPEAALQHIRQQLGRLGATIFEAPHADATGAAGQNAMQVGAACASWAYPASLLNALRREAVSSLEQVRATAYQRPQRLAAVAPPVAYPDTSLSYLGNVFNQQAFAFYQRHGVQLVAPAFEAMQESGAVSLMITKHCVRYSLSLCPKQAKGVVGVQGTVRAEPLELRNGKERLTLRFDCKACEMHVEGKIKPAVAHKVRRDLAAVQAQPLRFTPRVPRPVKSV